MLSAYGLGFPAGCTRRLLAIEPDTVEGRKLRRGIEKCRDKLFVFVTRRDVPPTNNVSEQRLRPSVIFRKVTNGPGHVLDAKFLNVLAGKEAGAPEHRIVMAEPRCFSAKRISAWPFSLASQSSQLISLSWQ